MTTKGIIAGNFDLIHPGYIKLFKEAKKHCDYLIIALHENPEHKKIKPLLSVEERAEILMAIRYVDEVVTYKTEDDMEELLKMADVKINGSDHREDGRTFAIPEIFLERVHTWSITKLKKMIAKQMENYYDD